MQIVAYRAHMQTFWRHAWSAYATDVRRLDAASRMMAFAAVFLGVLSGLVPVGFFVVLFRLTDALVGARAVRIQTSDLREALVTAGVVWLLATCVAVGRELLQGVAARVTTCTARFVVPASLLVCMFLVMPLRALFMAAILFVAEAWSAERRVRIGATLFVALVGLSGVATVLTYILSRSITVGGFLLFAGIIAGYTSWFVLRRIAPSTSSF